MGHANALSRLGQIRSQLQRIPELPFAEWLPAEQIEPVLAEAGVEFRQRLYTPVITIWMFLSQVLSPDGSCRDAVARLLAWLAARGHRLCSPDDSSYCQARQRLPLSVIQTLARRASAMPSESAWLWKGRHVKIVDGSSVTLSDTRVNQAAFPQPHGQAPGLGFPMARLVAVFSLAWGTVLDHCLSPMQGRDTGEPTLFRRLWHVFTPGDVVLGDRGFDCYRDLAGLRERGVDVVLRKNGSRRCDFRLGRWLGVGDHLVTWSKPHFQAERFRRRDHQALPDQMTVREVRYRVETPGFRSHTIILVTSLCNAATYSRADLADLYAQRWHCELDLNALKTTLGLGHVECRSPAMVAKSVAMHLLAYNLLRQIMAQAARSAQVRPRELSVKGAVQLVNAFSPLFAQLDADRPALLHALLDAIAHHRVGQRPGRAEPRKQKRRHARYSNLSQPRTKERQRLAA